MQRQNSLSRGRLPFIMTNRYVLGMIVVSIDSVSRRGQRSQYAYVAQMDFHHKSCPLGP